MYLCVGVVINVLHSGLQIFTWCMWFCFEQVQKAQSLNFVLFSLKVFDKINLIFHCALTRDERVLLVKLVLQIVTFWSWLYFTCGNQFEIWLQLFLIGNSCVHYCRFFLAFAWGNEKYYLCFHLYLFLLWGIWCMSALNSHYIVHIWRT